RADKYDWLLENEVSTTEWAEFEPQKPFYVFVPQNIDLLAEYRDGVKIIDVFLQNATGVKTHRDHFVVDFDQETLLKRINDFRNLSLSDEHIGKNYKLRDTRDWKLGPNRRSLSDVDNWREHVVTHLYRPFDFRSLYYHPNVVELPRTELMQHMLHRENLGLSISRGYEIGRGFEHVLCTNSLITNHSISLKESNYLLPLYLYPEKREGELFDVEDDGSAWPLSAQGRRPNLNPDFVKDMEQRLGLTFITEGRGDLVATFGPEDVFAYAYAVFHSSTYRERYAEFLKIDFPRLPLTRDVDLFRVLVEKGSALVDLHLLRHPALDRRLTCYDVPGDNVVESGYPKFTPHPPAPSSYDGEGESSSAKRDGGEDRRSASATGRVYINKTQYFD